MNGQGWIRAGESGPEVGVEGAGPEGRDARSSWSEVGDGDDDDGDFYGLAVKAG